MVASCTAVDRYRMTNWTPGKPRKISSVLQIVAFFLVVFGARLWLVQNYGNALPFWDQWDAEAANLIKPWLDGTLTAGSLFAPHNEHRIVLTRLLALGLFKVNGQWDALLEMTVNAALFSVVAVLLAFVAVQLFPRFRSVILIFLALLFVLPYSWENILAGFQSQFYFLLLFSLIAIWALTLHSWSSPAWSIGVISLFLASLSMASGFFAAVAALVLLTLRWAGERRRPSSSEYITALLCAVVAAAGWMTRTDVPGHAVLKAKSIAEWCLAFARCAAWPWYTAQWVAMVMQLPLLVLTTLYFGCVKSRQGQDRRTVELLLAIGVWWVGQSAAVAYARGAPAEQLSSRYMDIFSVGAAVNFFAALVLFRESMTLRWKKLPVFLLAIWLVTFASGLIVLTVNNFRADLPGRRDMMHREEENVRGYVRSGNAQRYLDLRPELDLPYPDKARLQAFLDDPVIRGILPAKVRPRLHLDVVTAGSGVAAGPFVQSGADPKAGFPSYETVWGSYAAEGNGAQGQWRGLLESAPLLPYLQVDISGHLGEPDLGLELHDESSGRTRALYPGRSAGQRWQTNIIRSPGKHRLFVVATDQNPAKWFAFTEPVEVGRLSYWTLILLRQSRSIFIAGGVLLISTFLSVSLRRSGAVGELGAR